MVNPLDHWFRVLFGSRFQIPLRGLPDFQRTGFQMLLRGLYGFCVTPGFLVQVHYLPIPFWQSFEFSFFFCWFQISWLHSSVVTYRVIFCDLIRQVFLFHYRELVEMILLYSFTYPIKSYYSIHTAICRCVVSCP